MRDRQCSGRSESERKKGKWVPGREDSGNKVRRVTKVERQGYGERRMKVIEELKRDESDNFRGYSCTTQDDAENLRRVSSTFVLLESGGPGYPCGCFWSWAKEPEYRRSWAKGILDRLPLFARRTTWYKVRRCGRVYGFASYVLHRISSYGLGLSRSLAMLNLWTSTWTNQHPSHLRGFATIFFPLPSHRNFHILDLVCIHLRSTSFSRISYFARIAVSITDTGVIRMSEFFCRRYVGKGTVTGNQWTNSTQVS